MLKQIVSSHSNPTLSGVAKFNIILAKHLKIPCLSFEEAQLRLKKSDNILLSVKLIDAEKDELTELKKLLKKMREMNVGLTVFFHTFDELPEEYNILTQSQKVFCANSEIKHALIGFDKELNVLWCPSLIDPLATISEKAMNIFSFGMAHKLQLKYYKILFDNLSHHKINYSLWISTAFHEKSSFGDFQDISSQLISIFGNRVQFLGFLSDVSINYFLERVQLFAAFFPKGVRANNTSVYVPMKKGCPVLINTDTFSPKWMKHGLNILDINRLKYQDLNSKKLQLLALRAKKDVERHANWAVLIKFIKSAYNK